MHGKLYEDKTKINLIEGVDNLAYLESESVIQANAVLKLDSLSISGQAQTRSAFVMASDKYDLGDFGTLNASVSSQVEFGGQFGFDLSKKGLDISAGLGGEAVLFKASVNYQTENYKLLGGFITFQGKADADFNAVGIGGNIESGYVAKSTASGFKFKATAGAGLTAFIGAKFKLASEIAIDFSKISSWKYFSDDSKE